MCLIEENKYVDLIVGSARKGDLNTLKSSTKEFNDLNPQVKNASKKYGDAAFSVALDNLHLHIAEYLVEAGLFDPSDTIRVFVTSHIEHPAFAAVSPEEDEDPSFIFQFLISLGADINYLTINGYTPLDIAAYWHYDKAADFLRKAGAKHSKVFEETGEV